jgi:hypothetical protein
MAQKPIGPNFANELAAAGLGGQPISWDAAGDYNIAGLNTAQQAQFQTVLAAHNAAAPDPNAAAAALLVGGLVLTSTGTPALNGTYPADATSQQKITSEQVYIATTGRFTNGQATRAWLDINGAAHVFPDVAHFTAFAEAVAQFVDAVQAAQAAALAGGTWAAPSNTATIA